MVSMTSNRTSLEAAAVDAGTTKRAEAGRIPCLPAAFATPSSSSLTSTLGGALLLLSFSGLILVICHSRIGTRRVSIRGHAVTSWLRRLGAGGAGAEFLGLEASPPPELTARVGPCVRLAWSRSLGASGAERC
eukprot:scaffold39100_cov61-Phaeocystis_antarctica.AAC.1